MGTAERRYSIMKILCRRRHENIRNLSEEFGVSERTIRRDIEALSYTEPIYTQKGRYHGGVYIVDGYYIDRMYMSDEEIMVLLKVYQFANDQQICALKPNEIAILKKVIDSYTKPSRQKESE